MIKKFLFVVGASALAFSTYACKDSMPVSTDTGGSVTTTVPFTKLAPDFTSAGHNSILPSPNVMVEMSKKHHKERHPQPDSLGGNPNDSLGHGHGFWDDDSLEHGDSLGHDGPWDNDSLCHGRGPNDSLDQHGRHGDHDGNGPDDDGDGLDTVRHRRDRFNDTTGCGFGDVKELRFRALPAILQLTPDQAANIQQLFNTFNTNAVGAQREFHRAYDAVYSLVIATVTTEIEAAMTNGTIDYKTLNDIMKNALQPYQSQLDAAGMIYRDAVKQYEAQLNAGMQQILTPDQYRKWLGISQG